jgi:hypothetical protein
MRKKKLVLSNTNASFVSIVLYLIHVPQRIKLNKEPIEAQDYWDPEHFLIVAHGPQDFFGGTKMVTLGFVLTLQRNCST